MLFIASELEKCNYRNDFVVHLYGIILSDNNDLALSLTGDTRMCMCNYYVVSLHHVKLYVVICTQRER